MKIAERIDLLAQLGDWLQQNNEEWQVAKQKALWANPWFTADFIDLSVTNIVDRFLRKPLLQDWITPYNLPAQIAQPKTVGIVMAGNLPLVGFHDFLCVFISGHRMIIKPSAKDDVLLRVMIEKLHQWDARTKEMVSFAEILKGCNAYIATGSNNSGRYFEYYFGQYPNIIRRNRTSVALLDGTETPEELSALADDIQLYFGLGCRNVTQLYVPQGYDFIPLLDALKKYNHLADNHKYKHNFDYHLALLIMNSKFYMNNGSVILAENISPFSPVSQVHFQYYTDKKAVEQALSHDEQIQCITGHGHIPLGTAQSPALNDYADGVDTMSFLAALSLQ